MEPIPLEIFDDFKAIETIPESAISKTQDLAHLINEKIAEFNGTESDEKKRSTLYEIFQLQQKSDIYIPGNHITQNDKFRKVFHQELYTAIQKEFQRLEVHSLEKNDLESAIKGANKPSSEIETLSQLIANLPPDKIDKIAQIISDVCSSNSSNMDTALSERLSHMASEEDTDKMLDVLQNHSIRILGRQNNIVLLVEDSIRGTSSILKLQKAMGGSQETVARLMDSETTKSIFTDIYATRQATYTDKETSVTNSLSIEEYCPKGDLFSESLALHRELEAIDPGIEVNEQYKPLLEHAIHRFQQMASHLLRLQNEGAIHPDTKGSNWLIGADGSLKAADTKAIVNSEEGKFALARFELPISTPAYSPPEFNLPYRGRLINSSGEQAETFIAGKSLYQYLTTEAEDRLDFTTESGETKLSGGKLKEDFEGAKDYYENEEQYVFRHKVFETSGGKALKELIKNLVNETPEERPSLAQTIEKLEDIKMAMQTSRYRETTQNLRQEDKSEELNVSEGPSKR